ncbi:MAG: hypothetical protein Q7J06_06310, partial [Bacteroidales bacterium]|nr:hypothetical protein [Bacteroidales bacterium]
ILNDAGIGIGDDKNRQGRGYRKKYGQIGMFSQRPEGFRVYWTMRKRAMYVLPAPGRLPPGRMPKMTVRRRPVLPTPEQVLGRVCEK